MDKKEALLDQLEDMFHFVTPDEDFLLEDESTTLDVEKTQETIDDKDETIENKIAALYHFNSEWFPDGLRESEKAEYRTLLNDAKAILENK